MKRFFYLMFLAVLLTTNNLYPSRADDDILINNQPTQNTLSFNEGSGTQEAVCKGLEQRISSEKAAINRLKLKLRSCRSIDNQLPNSQEYWVNKVFSDKGSTSSKPDPCKNIENLIKSIRLDLARLYRSYRRNGCQGLDS